MRLAQPQHEKISCTRLATVSGNKLRRRVFLHDGRILRKILPNGRLPVCLRAYSSLNLPHPSQAVLFPLHGTVDAAKDDADAMHVHQLNASGRLQVECRTI